MRVAEYQFVLSETQTFPVSLGDPTPQDAKCQLSFWVNAMVSNSRLCKTNQIYGIKEIPLHFEIICIF